MSPYAFFAMAVTVILAGETPRNHTGKEERAKLQGSWRIVAGEIRGKMLGEQDLKDARQWRVLFKGNRMTVRFDRGSEKQSAVYLGEAQKYHAIDLVGLDGPDQGIISKGIWRFEGDHLRLCYNNKAGDDRRPEEFKTTADSDLMMVVLERAKR